MTSRDSCFLSWGTTHEDRRCPLYLPVSAFTNCASHRTQPQHNANDDEQALSARSRGIDGDCWLHSQPCKRCVPVQYRQCSGRRSRSSGADRFHDRRTGICQPSRQSRFNRYDTEDRRQNNAFLFPYLDAECRDDIKFRGIERPASLWQCRHHRHCRKFTRWRSGPRIDRHAAIVHRKHSCDLRRGDALIPRPVGLIRPG